MDLATIHNYLLVLIPVFKLAFVQCSELEQTEYVNNKVVSTVITKIHSSDNAAIKPKHQIQNRIGLFILQSNGGSKGGFGSHLTKELNHPIIQKYLNDKFDFINYDLYKDSYELMNLTEADFVKRYKTDLKELTPAIFPNKIKLSPEFIILNTTFQRVGYSPGVKNHSQILAFLTYYGEGHYLKMTIEEYKNGKFKETYSAELTQLPN